MRTCEDGVEDLGDRTDGDDRGSPAGRKKVRRSTTHMLAGTGVVGQEGSTKALFGLRSVSVTTKSCEYVESSAASTLEEIERWSEGGE